MSNHPRIFLEHHPSSRGVIGVDSRVLKHIIEDRLLHMEAAIPVTLAEFVTIWDKVVNIDTYKSHDHFQ